MSLPPALRQAIDSALAGVSLPDLARSSDTLSQRYRNEVRDGRPHVGDRQAMLAYLAARLPATYAAARAAFAAAAAMRPDFAPATLLDAGAGPGTATWAAAAAWPTLADATLIEASGTMRAAGETLGAPEGVRRAYVAADIGTAAADTPRAELVVLAYVLGELTALQNTPLVARLWAATTDMFVIVEPGTTAGWKRILAARDSLLGAGAYILAPCPHTAPCPVREPDWCHFSARLDRSRLHRQAKGAEVPWEDEKFAYLVASRQPGRAPAPRVLAPPLQQSGRVTLKLCLPKGALAVETISRREGDRYRIARRLDWGDRFATDAEEFPAPA